jgi:galactonate dehydratase
MKITGIETYIVGNPWKIWVFARVMTDGGIYGIGEGSLGHMSHAVEGAIQDIKQFVIGADPFDVEWITNRVTRDIYADGGQIKMSALAAIEIACWDIMGKATGLPVYKLLGGKCHPKLRAYANGWYRCDLKPELFAERALKVKQLGYTAMKFDPFGASWRIMTPREEDLSIDIIRAVRDAVGPQVDLMIEAHSRFGVAQAIQICKRIEQFRPAWFEEPVPHHNPIHTVEVARATSVPIATGESLSSKQAFADLLKHGAVQIVQMEPVHVGGILASRKIADMVDASYGMIAPHSAAGAVSTMACVHIDAATPNFYVQEFFHDFSSNSWEDELFTTSLAVKDGYIELPTEPGLGIDLNLDVARSQPRSKANEMNLWEDGWQRRRDKVTNGEVNGAARQPTTADV